MVDSNAPTAASWNGGEMKLFRRRRRRGLRNYVYVSDTKLDMFFEQIDPADRRQVSAELSLDLGIAGVAISTADQPAATRMAKLAVVERYIDNHHQVGTPGLPGREFFRGRMPMYWGALHAEEYLKDHPHDPARAAADLLVFRGFDPQDGSMVFLTGSPGHLIHQTQSEQAAVGLSSIMILQHLLELLDDDAYQPYDQVASRALKVGARCRIRGAQQYLQFLAVPFGDTFFPLPTRLGDPWAGDSSGPAENHGVIGTPLYVAHG
ncbi:SAVMC3_10250 family protein [Saccharomonospora sp. NPDC046836]|uniref:DUF7019 family protein n=1 Tax=Saccharomonospora sp. NPDC046836 TaxID=3156921 RepID=UPI0033FBAEF5